MKTLNLASALILSAAAIAPSIASASFADRSAAACAEAFAGRLASAGTAAPTYKLDFQSPGIDNSVTEYYATRYTFELSAREPKNKASIAHATCVTSRGGKVLSLTSLPSVDEGSPLAARL